MSGNESTAERTYDPRRYAPGELAALATRHGLRRSAARPRMTVYLRRLWDRRRFISAYADARNTSKYSGTVIGRLWQVITPLLNAAVYFVMFGLILGGGAGVDNYVAFLVTGMFVFTYTQRTVAAGGKSVSANLSLIRALHFPRAILPIAYTLQELQQLFWSMLVLLPIVLLDGGRPSAHWLLVPVALFLQTLFNAGAALIAARLGTQVRDLNQLMPFITRTWLYLSGIFFSIQDKVVGHPAPDGEWSGAHLPQWVADLMYANPAAAYIELMRGLLMSDTGPTATTWLTCAAWALIGCVGGVWYFWSAEERYGRG
ncbi:ABC transporter [Spongiactinospora gelatinilytica]|uniref:Transport permease protein n=1 Tax=Spongiactinospora gelatinilytica TaxID=2666298 RepID=A0A2W2EJN2_9ACTN|nr:ABC transporter permease [Spongiactinospora gelatinilytica]PZG24496.1 ABC transporter [Spongiactinospora gelatinilytica]